MKQNVKQVQAELLAFSQKLVNNFIRVLVVVVVAQKPTHMIAFV